VSFNVVYTATADLTFRQLEDEAKKANENRLKNKIKKSSKQEGLFKQVYKTIKFLAENPRHPSLKTHEFDSIPNPYNKEQKVFEAYAQNNTPGAYRVFWCYGPNKIDITIIAITPHP
jgi:hypothetical protein